MAKKTLVSSSGTPTAAGPTGSDSIRQEVVSAINQMFAEFELVFHNQYHKAFATKEKEDWAKKLWYNNLKEYSAAEVLDAAHRAIKESEFLPTVRGVLKYIDSHKPVLPPLVALPETASMTKEQKQAAINKLRRDTGL